MGSGWFDYTELSLTTSSQGEQGEEGNCTLVPCGSAAPHLLEPPHIASLMKKECV